MNQLSIEETLKLGITAHKRGRLHEADRFYKAILKIQPKHPDANHNMGVLAVSVGKIEDSLPFFKMALRVNPFIDQYWLSYMDALLKLNRLADAKVAFAEAKSKHLKNETLVQLEIKLGEINIFTKNQKLENNFASVLILMDKGELDKAISLGKSKLQNFSNDPSLMAIISRCYLLKDKLGEAEEMLEAARKIEPDNALVGWNSSRLFLRKKKPNLALEQARKTLKNFPNDVEGLVVLAACLTMCNLRDESFPIINKIIQDDPNHVEALINRATIFLSEGKKNEALRDLVRAFELKPHLHQIWKILGSTYMECIKYHEAAEFFKKLIKREPNEASYLFSLASCLQSLGDLPSSIKHYKEALKIKPSFVEVYINMGVALKLNGDLDGAIQSFRKALSLKSDLAEAYYNLGLLYKDKSDLRSSFNNYQKAIEIKPDYIEAHNNIGNLHKDVGDFDAAIRCYQKVLSINPDYAVGHNNLGVAFKEIGNQEAAIDSYRKALKLKPDYAEVFNNMAAAFQDQGDELAALKYYNRSLEIKPNYALAHRNLSVIKIYHKRDKQYLQMQELYNSCDLDDEQKCHLCFALSKSLEDLGDFEGSFEILREGNSLRKKLLDYHISTDIELFKNLKKSFSNHDPSLFGGPIKSTDPVPLFIVGMPRSGTTLIEQIISSHSDVAGLGELPFFGQHGSTISLGFSDTSAELLHQFREKYLLEIKKGANKKRFTIDKMPINFLYIGLIYSVFPEAKVVHVKRDPIATCWSNYKQFFSVKGLGFCYDLNDLVTYHGLYVDLMQFWSNIYGDRIYHLDYDELTVNQEDATRQLINYLGLAWQDACLSPQNNRRSVSTASNVQIRRKVYQGSSQKWRKFKPLLEGVFDKLESSG